MVQLSLFRTLFTITYLTQLPVATIVFFNSYGKYQLFVDDQLILTEDSVRLYGDCFGTDSAGIYTQQLFQITYPEDDSMRLQFNKIR